MQEVNVRVVRLIKESYNYVYVFVCDWFTDLCVVQRYELFTVMSNNVLNIVCFSRRTLGVYSTSRSSYVIANTCACRLVCGLSVTLVHPTQRVELRQYFCTF